MKSFAVAVICLVAGATSSVQAAVGPEKATEMLAHAWMIDNRCNVLDKNDRDVLTGLVARAEISLAEKVSVKAARGAIAKGRASGTAAPCDRQSAESVTDTLKAAVSAAAIGDMDAPAAAAAAQPQAPAAGVEAEKKLPEPGPALVAAEPEDDEATVAEAPVQDEALVVEPESVDVPVVVPKRVLPARKAKPVTAQTAKPKPVRVVAKRTKPVVLASATKRLSGGGYGTTAENYYRELRCRRMSLRAVNAMYARVLREHRRAVATNGKAAVRQILRAAESRASGGSC